MTSFQLATVMFMDIEDLLRAGAPFVCPWLNIRALVTGGYTTGFLLLMLLNPIWAGNRRYNRYKNRDKDRYKMDDGRRTMDDEE